MNIKRETTQPVYVSVVEYIHTRIKQGELKPGDPLLSERELCEQFGVSRTSVRKALAILSGMGLVDVTPRNGAYVAEINSQLAIDSLSQMIARNRYQAAHLYEVRRLIEVQAARLAAIRRDEADMIRLRELHHLVKESLQNPVALHRADMNLHIGIAESAKNPFFAELMRVLISAYMEIFDVVWARQGLNEEEQALFAHYIQQHGLIVEAIADKDPEAAAAYVTQHIDDSRKRYERVLSEKSKA
jgi:GntR family transcriptional repressor for pyruvate dehydrogenase complex